MRESKAIWSVAIVWCLSIILILCFNKGTKIQNQRMMKLTVMSTDYGSLRSLQSVTAKTMPSRFVYLLQTESCIPKYLMSADAIGNTSVCQCDVLVLSFKQQCKDLEMNPTHIEYLYDSSTTWGGGRNLLYEAARKRNEKYLYYILFDDDIVLKLNSAAHTKMSPWRLFENFLKSTEPAVAAIDKDNHPFLPRALKARKKQGCLSNVNETTECVSTARFDGAFNAFHYQAVEHILPYSTEFDEHRWSNAMLYAAIKIEVMFAGQSVIHTQLIAKNTKDRPYPRDRKHIDIYLVSMLDEIKLSIPEKYQNSSLLLAWRNRSNHESNSETYCMPPPYPHMPIRPFFYLEAKDNHLKIS